MASFDGEPLDCLVVGAGPAGLTAAIYLARFRRRFLVIGGDDSRAAWIPRSHNHAGNPEGITGHELLARMAAQAERYGASIHSATVTGLKREQDGVFTAVADGRIVRAQTVLLATGVVDEHPPLADPHAAVQRGLLRYCGICDAYEVIDRRLAVVGPGDHGAREALFLRNYGRDITLYSPPGASSPSAELGRRLTEAGIVIKSAALAEVAVGDHDIAVTAEDGGREVFDHLYSALGNVVRSDLAAGLGASVTDQCCIVTDAHQNASVDGLFAAGDVIVGLDQVSVAMGHAAIAATAIHNRLRGA